jgi:hypothetical protein
MKLVTLQQEETGFTTVSAHQSLHNFSEFILIFPTDFLVTNLTEWCRPLGLGMALYNHTDSARFINHRPMEDSAVQKWRLW